MALTIKGIGSDGRVTTGTAVSVSAGVLIPAENAGVGDIVYCKSGADPKDPASLKVIGCGTVSDANNITVAGAAYIVYGVIYGFVSGMARIVAKEEAARRWSMLASDTGSEAANGDSELDAGFQLADTTVSGACNPMRNGNKATYAGMNLDSMMRNNYTGANTIIHPTAAWSNSAVMSKANFDALAPGSGNAKDEYGTWENYLRQTLAVNGAPGSCFGVHSSGVKVHEQGKWNTQLIGRYTKSSPDSNTGGSGACWYPAANYCYNYAVSGAGETAANHNWWLPSMNELYDLMQDAHWVKVNKCGAATLNNRAARWSSVRYSAAYAWNSSNNGFSTANYARNAMTARPVTLLKLV